MVSALFPTVDPSIWLIPAASRPGYRHTTGYPVLFKMVAPVERVLRACGHSLLNFSKNATLRSAKKVFHSKALMAG